MALDAPAVALGQFVFGEGGEGRGLGPPSRRGPAFAAARRLATGAEG